MEETVHGKKVALLVGGSDLFSGLRGISPGTVRIRKSIKPWFNDVLAVNYNYFLDFGRSLAAVKNYLQTAGQVRQLVLYGYSKEGDVVLQLARSLEKKLPIDLLVTIDIANGPWSDKIDRSVPGNVKKNINVFQSTPNLLRSCGAAALASGNTEIKNINLTDQSLLGQKVTHGNMEILMVPQVIRWLTTVEPVYL